MLDPGILPEEFEDADVTEISAGMSGDGKFLLTTEDGRKLLLRLSGREKHALRKKEYAFIKHLNQAGIPMPKAAAFGTSADGNSVYMLVTWMEGEPAGDIVPGLPEDEQYALGRQSGRVLRRVHDASPRGDTLPDWHDRYFAVLGPRLTAFEEEGEWFDGADRILAYIAQRAGLLYGRPQTGHHGDYHMGNMIVSRGGELSVIDWHTVDFQDGGDPWFEFNRVGAEVPAFARGQIDGYFDGNVPQEFWQLFALYVAASAITSIVWAKHHAPEELPRIMALNHSVLEWFDGMQNPVPTWYRGA